jgi:hypothetical protein
MVVVDEYTFSNQSRACLGRLYCVQCAFRSSTRVGKTDSNSFNVVGMIAMSLLLRNLVLKSRGRAR